jgi:hypothetical protein
MGIEPETVSSFSLYAISNHFLRINTIYQGECDRFLLENFAIL